MRRAAETLEELAIGFDARIVSAHRTPDRLVAFAKGSSSASGELQSDHRGRRRRGASARHDRGLHTAAGVRRPRRLQGALRAGQPVVDRPDARRGAGWNPWRSARRSATNAALLAAAVLALSVVALAQRLEAWRAAATNAGGRPACGLGLHGAPNDSRARRPRSAFSAPGSSAACSPWRRRASGCVATSSLPRPRPRRAMSRARRDDRRL